MESNITLRSNVYINRTRRRNDIDFVRHLRDYDTLREYYDPVYRTSEVPLTEVQYELMNHGSPKCSLEKGTQSWGVPVGSERFVCRCEEVQCPRYSICSVLGNFELVSREADGNEQKVPPILSDSIDDSIPREKQAEQIEKQSIFSTESDDINVPNPSKIIRDDDKISTAAQCTTEPCHLQEETFSEISSAPGALYSSQDAIINADISSRICVNAGPGTGKTYIVIKRLQRLLERGNPAKAILVLCFSKNAVYVIKERLRVELGNQVDALVADERLIIRTFDSFATYMLADELPKGLDYDQRIELFSRKSAEHPDLFNSVEYLIVDETQDTFGARARMLKTIVEQSSFGVLLLGDHCQAIYDWAARSVNDWTSTDLFAWMKGQGFQTFELERNHRQEREIGELGNIMRQSLLNDGEDEQEQTLTLCKKKIESLWPGCAMSELPRSLLQENDLILCKTNGEAAAVSDLLYGGSKFIEHTVRQSADHKTLAPWIGMILGGCTDPIVSKDNFLARAEARGVEDAGVKWDALLSLDSHVRSEVLHRLEVLARLATLDDLPDICLNCPGESVIVSTVHRAKGSEAEHAYWMDSPLVFDSWADEPGTKSDALKAAYVAMTRAKKDLHLIHLDEKNYMRPLVGDRWVKLDYSRGKYPVCTQITLQPNDVDFISCASGKDFAQMQEIISTLIPGMDLQLYPSGGGKIFDIFFEGILVGKTAENFGVALRNALNAPGMNLKYRNPHNIDSAYISDLVTVIQLSGTDVENEYQASGCWLGYELGGFAHINYT